jgi:hypothetical protein
MIKSFGKINFTFLMKRKFIVDDYTRCGMPRTANSFIWTRKTYELHVRYREILRDTDITDLTEYITGKWHAYLDKCLLVCNRGKWDIDFEPHTRNYLWSNYALRVHMLEQKFGPKLEEYFQKMNLPLRPLGKFYTLIRSLIRYWEITYYLRETFPFEAPPEQEQ